MTRSAFLSSASKTARLVALCVVASSTSAWAAPRSGDIEITVIDENTNKPIACRMHLKNARGVARRAPKLPFLEDHFVFDGTLSLTLREGNYRFEAECGPEYRTRVGHFSVGRFGADAKTISMKRIVDMSAAGWWSGDLHVHRRPTDIQLLMRAEDLHIAQVMTWSNKKDDLAKQSVKPELFTAFDANRYYHTRAGRDVRAGGGLSVFHLEQPLPGLLRNATLTAEYPPTVQLADAVREQDGVWMDADTLTARDLPVWVAHGVVDSVRLANHRYGRTSHVDEEPGQRARNKSIYGGANGLGRWSDHVYSQLLNCGLRLPPSAGSGSGDVPNPVGYNRVYVYCGKDFSYDNWWQGLRAGRVVITNGPLLRPQVEGQLPGHVFQGTVGKRLKLQPQLQLATKDKIEYLEVIKNGDIVHVVRLDNYVERKGKLPIVEFDDSGWFLVRVVTNVGATYRFASSGPYYVEFDSKIRISRRAAEFFHDWVNERAGQLKIADADQYREVRKYHDQAREFWKDLIERATAD